MQLTELINIYVRVHHEELSAVTYSLRRSALYFPIWNLSSMLLLPQLVPLRDLFCFWACFTPAFADCPALSVGEGSFDGTSGQKYYSMLQQHVLIMYTCADGLNIEDVHVMA